MCLVCSWLWLLKSCCHCSPLVQGRGFGSARARGQILALPVLAPDPDFPLQPFPVPTAEKGRPSPHRLPRPLHLTQGHNPCAQRAKRTAVSALLLFPQQSWTNSSLRSHPSSDFWQEGPFSFPAFPPPVRFSWRASTFASLCCCSCPCSSEGNKDIPVVLLSREVSQVDSSQLPCPLSTPSKSPAVTLCPGTIPRGLWDVLEYLSPSQCRKQWEFSKDRTQQQEARGAAHLQCVQLGGK